MTPYAAALFAARSVREQFAEDDSTGVVLQVVGPATILSLALPELPEALALAPTLGGLAEQLVLVADAYHASLAAGATVPDHGDLQERHAIGDATVSEALIVVGVKRSEDAARVTVLPYARDAGEVRWRAPFQLQPLPNEGGIGGRIVRGLAGALALTPAPTGDVAPLMAWAAGQLNERGIAADVIDR